MITRQQYMANTKLHHEYFSQFITSATKKFIEGEIGIDKLLTSNDEHLNDLYKHSNGGAGSWVWDYTPINMTLLRELGESNTPSTHTCVGKAYARQLIAEHKS